VKENVKIVFRAYLRQNWVSLRHTSDSGLLLRILSNTFH